jgi:hypothetical protein
MHKSVGIVYSIVIFSSLFLALVPNVHAWKDYWGRGTEREYLPVTVLYDPYGDNSYQQIKSTYQITTTFSFKGVGAGVSASGSVTSQVSYYISYSSSKSTTNPADIGPGKGDRVIGKIYELTWDIWEIISTMSWRYYYKLVSARLIGTFVLSRNDLKSTSDTTVEDKTGQVGTYRHLWDISANTEVTHEVSYLWSGTVAVGFSYMVNILGLQNGLSFSLSFTGTQTYAVAAHYMDSSKRIKFYENAQSANPAVDKVYSYVFWYSPA